MSRKCTRYGLLVRKIRIGYGDSVEAASRKIGLSEREIVNVEDRGWKPSGTFDFYFRRAYPQSEPTSSRLDRFLTEAQDQKSIWD